MPNMTPVTLSDDRGSIVCSDRHSLAKIIKLKNTTIHDYIQSNVWWQGCRMQYVPEGATVKIASYEEVSEFMKRYTEPVESEPVVHPVVLTLDPVKPARDNTRPPWMTGKKPTFIPVPLKEDNHLEKKRSIDTILKRATAKEETKLARQETKRAKAEADRAQAEIHRAHAEADRAQAETERVQANMALALAERNAAEIMASWKKA